MSKSLLQAKWLKAHWALLPLTYTLIACSPDSTSDSSTSPSSYKADDAEVAEQEGDADDSKEGIVSVAITDNLSTDYAEVWVSLKEIDVKTGTESQTLYKNTSGLAVNLSELTDVSQVLSQVALSTGTYTDFSVTLGADVVLVDANGNVTNAKLSNNQTDVEWAISGNLAVSNTSVSQLSLDFNLAQFDYDRTTGLVNGVVSQLADSEYRAPYAHMSGTIDSIGASQLTLTPSNSTVPLTITKGSATRIYSGHTVTSFDQLTVGDRIEFYGQYDATQNTVTAYKIETDSDYLLAGESEYTNRGKVEGIVQSVEGQTLTLDLKHSDRLPTQNSITVSNILNANYKTGSATTLAVNQSLEVRGTWTTDGFSASLIEIEGAAESDKSHDYQDGYVELKGLISGVSGNQATLTVADVEHSQSYNLGEAVVLDLSQAWYKNADASCLENNAYVEAKGAATDTGLKVNSLEIKAACVGQNGVSKFYRDADNHQNDSLDHESDNDSNHDIDSSDHDSGYSGHGVTSSDDKNDSAEVEGVIQSINGNSVTMSVVKYEHFAITQTSITVDVANAWYDDGTVNDLVKGRYIEIKGNWDGTSMNVKKVSF